MTMQMQTENADLPEAEATVARLFWEGKIPGRKQAEVAVILLETLCSADGSLTMDQILEGAGARGEDLRIRPGAASPSKVSETTRVAMRTLVASGAVKRIGRRYSVAH